LLSVLVVGKEALNWTSLSQGLGTSALIGFVALSLIYFLSNSIADELRKAE